MGWAAFCGVAGFFFVVGALFASTDSHKVAWTLFAFGGALFSISACLLAS